MPLAVRTRRGRLLPFRSRPLRLLALMLGALLVPPLAHASDYTLIDTGAFGGARSEPYALNDRGYVVGTAQPASGAYRAFLWSSLGGNDRPRDPWRLELRVRHQRIERGCRLLYRRDQTIERSSGRAELACETSCKKADWPRWWELPSFLTREYE